MRKFRFSIWLQKRILPYILFNSASTSTLSWFGVTRGKALCTASRFFGNLVWQQSIFNVQIWLPSKKGTCFGFNMHEKCTQLVEGEKNCVSVNFDPESLELLEMHLPVIYFGLMATWGTWDSLTCGSLTWGFLIYLGLVDLSYLRFTYLRPTDLRALDIFWDWWTSVTWDSLTCDPLTWEFLIFFGTYGLELLEIQIPLTHWTETSWYK